MKKIRYLLLLFVLICSSSFETFGQDVPKPPLILELMKQSGIKPLRVDNNMKLYLDSLFSPNVNMIDGIIGTVNPGEFIFVHVHEKEYNTLIYEVFTTTTTTVLSGQGSTFSRNDLGAGATYFPAEWYSRDIRTSAFSMDRKYVDAITQKPTPMLRQPIEVTVSIEIIGNARFQTIRIPGIGEIGENPFFDHRHRCFGMSEEEFPCSTWAKIKSPDLDASSDFILAAHRGIWGENLGNSAPENSEGSIKATTNMTHILETDVMITKDDQLIISHDYNMDRLTNFAGTNMEFLFDRNFSEVANLNLRRRNETVSDYKYLRLDDLIDLLKQEKLVVMIDIKEKIAWNRDGQCLVNCDYVGEKRKEHWFHIFKLCYQKAKEKNALEYITFKIPHSYDDVLKVLTEDEIAQVLFMPVLQPYNGDDAVERAVSKINDWHGKGGKKLVAIETNFKLFDDKILQPFIRDGHRYDNMLHYVYVKTGLRSGIFAEEPVGTRGLANRWGDWLMLNCAIDMRGDHYGLASVPYGKLMVMTTDRPDIWIQIAEMYNAIYKASDAVNSPNSRKLP